MFLKGEKIGGYVLERRLGRGLEGEVWRARAPEGTVAAVKIYTESVAIQTLRRTGVPSTPAHPYICKVLGADLEHHLPWVATEFANGPTLREELAQAAGGRLPAATALERVRHAARGVAALHRAGLAHHDLRPENILYDTDRKRARLADVMTAAAHRDLIARLLDPRHAAPIPADRAAAILPYIAPELLKRPERAVDGPRGDVWALGVIAYEALTGARPAPGLDIPFPSQRERTVPRALDEVVMRCLERSPRARPGNAIGVEAMLDEIAFERK